MMASMRADHERGADHVIVLIAADLLSKVEIEALGARVIETCDELHAVHHIRHALRDPMPIPDRRRGPDPEPDDNDLSDPEPLLCSKCRAEVVPTAEKPLHVAQARCATYGAQRWVGRVKLQRAAIDPATLALPADAQLTLDER